MKKIGFCLLLLFSFASIKAQLSNTSWKGTIQADESMNVVFRFTNDTLSVVNMGDGSTIETMKAVVKNNQLTLKKLWGQSDCIEGLTAEYKYEINNNEIVFTVITDDCQQRAAVLSGSKWTKAEY